MKKIVDEYVIFDVETLNEVSTKEGYTFENPENLGISIACTYTEEDKNLDWFGIEASKMMNYISKHDVIVGWNHMNFDYKVIAGLLAKNKTDKDYNYWYSKILKETENKNFDICRICAEKIGFRIGLEQVGNCYGYAKNMNGAEAPQMWDKRKRNEVIRYCRNDVLITKIAYDEIRLTKRLMFKYKGEKRLIEFKDVDLWLI